MRVFLVFPVAPEYSVQKRWGCRHSRDRLHVPTELRCGRKVRCLAESISIFPYCTGTWRKGLHDRRDRLIFPLDRRVYRKGEVITIFPLDRKIYRRGEVVTISPLHRKGYRKGEVVTISPLHRKLYRIGKRWNWNSKDCSPLLVLLQKTRNTMSLLM